MPHGCWKKGAARPLWVLQCMLVLAAGCAVMRADEPGVQPEANVVVATLPLGSAGVHYADEHVQELLPWGPAALRVAHDGTFWIVDSAADRLLHVAPDGGVLGHV